MTEPSSYQPNSQRLASTFQPPAGGDVSLKSCDGTTFLVHSLLLRLASTVFSDMFNSSTMADVVELAEDAEAISLMLAFIYPVMQPSIDTVDLFEKALLIAQKYDIDALRKTLDLIGDQKKTLVLKDPVRVFRLAVDHGLRDTQTLAAKLVGPQHYDTRSPKGLLELAKEFPGSSHIIGLVGVQGTRAALLETLLSPHNYRIWPKLDVERGPLHVPRKEQQMPPTQSMSCSTCWKRVKEGGITYYKPGWWELWVEYLRSALNRRPLEECDSYLRISCLCELQSYRAGVACVACINQTFTNHRLFEIWAGDIRVAIQAEVAKLDVLYEL